MSTTTTELHWAAQIASAAGATLLDAKSDASHTNLGWDRTTAALAGHPVKGRRAALRLEDGTLLVLDESWKVVASKPLAGETNASALRWLADAFDVAELRRPEHDMPAHAVAAGAPFTTRGDATLAKLFAKANDTLAKVAARESSATPVRCWPHHFDIATLLSLGDKKTIGVGLSPGDGSYADPYWYVTPWPYPKGDLPPLVRGAWHREGWTGAVLTAKIDAVSPFLDEAIAACRQSLQSSD